MSKIVLPADPLLDGATALRPWRDSDLQPLVAACQDPEISRWTRVPRPYGEADGRAYLLQRYDMTFTGAAAPFAVVDSGSGALLGSLSLLRISWRHRRAEVGYWLARDGRGAGHATRGVRLICRWGASALGIERVELMAATGNTASQSVAERAGFTREVVLRSYMSSWDERLDMVMFAWLSGAP